MKTIVHFEKIDYRILVVVAILTASVTAVLIEKALYHVSNESINFLISEYERCFVGFRFADKGYIRYLLHTELKKYILLIFLSFSVLGFPLNLMSLYLKIYRYIFLMSSLVRCGIGKNSVLCIAAVPACLVLSIPAYIHLLAVSNRSFDYCTKNHKRFYHCSKYKLQSEVKICIIILIYIVFESLLETIACGYLFGQMTQV